MVKLKLQHFGHLMQRADSLEKTLMLGKIGGERRSGWKRMRRIHSITDSMDLNLSKLWEIVCRTGEPGMLPSVGSQRVRHDLATEQQPQKQCFRCWNINGERGKAPARKFTF